MKRIYLDNASTTKVKPEVFQEMEPYLTDCYHNPSSMYDEGIHNKKLINSCRKIIAKHLNASPKEIYFCSGGSEANNWALKGIAFNHSEKKEIITTQIEHHSLMHTCDFLKKMGYEIKYVNVDKDGFVDLEHLRQLINENTLLVTIIYANNEIGTIQDIKEISNVCRSHHCLLHVDAVQGVCHTPIDVKEFDVDLLSISAHKFHGPKGIGCLYVKSGVEIENLIHGGKQEYGKRCGTENVANIVGMAKAMELASNAMEENARIQRELAKYLIDQLHEAKIDYILNGPVIGDSRLPGNINVSFKNVDNSIMSYLLNKEGICVSTGSACSTGSIEPSHVLKAIEVPVEYIHGGIRISLSDETTKDDIDYFCDVVIEIINSKKALKG